MPPFSDEPVSHNERRAHIHLQRGGTLTKCVRYYPNGDSKQEDRAPADVASWISWNQTYRPGNSLFVEAQCVSRGIGFSEQDCTMIEKCIARHHRWKPSETEPAAAPSPR